MNSQRKTEAANRPACHFVIYLHLFTGNSVCPAEKSYHFITLCIRLVPFFLSPIYIRCPQKTLIRTPTCCLSSTVRILNVFLFKWGRSGKTLIKWDIFYWLLFIAKEHGALTPGQAWLGCIPSPQNGLATTHARCVVITLPVRLWLPANEGKSGSCLLVCRAQCG